jgi:hypothetical protein
MPIGELAVVQTFPSSQQANAHVCDPSLDSIEARMSKSANAL